MFLYAETRLCNMVSMQETITWSEFVGLRFCLKCADIWKFDLVRAFSKLCATMRQKCTVNLKGASDLVLTHAYTLVTRIPTGVVYYLIILNHKDKKNYKTKQGQTRHNISSNFIWTKWLDFLLDKVVVTNYSSSSSCQEFSSTGLLD